MKIVDEHNRIPTRTQSVLIIVVSDNYAELMNQVYECPESCSAASTRNWRDWRKASLPARA